MDRNQIGAASERTDTRPLKIVLLGEWRYPHYEQALADGFERLGASVTPFKTMPYLYARGRGTMQKSVKLGPAINRLNRDLIALVDDVRPAALFIFIGHHVYASTVQQIKQSHPETVIVNYNHDNPFEDDRKFLRWRHYLAHARLCDLNYFVRARTVAHARDADIPNPRLVKHFYVKDFHHPMPVVPENYHHDVLFGGHYEPDGRGEMLSYLLVNGVAVTIFGNRWEELARDSPIRRLHRPIDSIPSEEYVKHMAGSKIVLVFLSGTNHDHYTSRCFEVPACKRLMLAPRNPEIQALYLEDEEVVLYGDKEELLCKVQKYLGDEEARERIAEAGHWRCLRDAHSNVDRCATMLAGIREFMNAPRLEVSSKLREPRFKV